MRKILKDSSRFILMFSWLLFACNQGKDTSKAIPFTCPMHPEIVNEGPGICPICKMDLVPKDNDDAHAAIDQSLNSLVKPSNELVISGIKTIKAEKGIRKADLNLQGVINYNSNQWKTVSSRFGGRIERLYVKYSYEHVRKGQKIMDIYSPDLLSAQQELIFLKNNSEPELLESAKKKLELLGLTQAQINQVLQREIVNPIITVYSPYSGYIADLEQNDLVNNNPQAGTTRISSADASGMNEMATMASEPSLETIPNVRALSSGQALQIREGQYINSGQKLFSLINTDQVLAEFYAGADQLNSFKKGSSIKVNALDRKDQEINTNVNLILPYYKEGYNFSLIRANIDNYKRSWKVGQLIAVHKEIELNGNWIPRSAVLKLGKKYIVFVNRKDAFVPIYVDVKAFSDNWIDIGESLTDSQKIAINAWFLVDTESFIKVEKL